MVKMRSCCSIFAAPASRSTGSTSNGGNGVSRIVSSSSTGVSPLFIAYLLSLLLSPLFFSPAGFRSSRNEDKTLFLHPNAGRKCSHEYGPTRPEQQQHLVHTLLLLLQHSRSFAFTLLAVIISSELLSLHPSLLLLTVEAPSAADSASTVEQRFLLPSATDKTAPLHSCSCCCTSCCCCVSCCCSSCCGSEAGCSCSSWSPLRFLRSLRR